MPGEHLARYTLCQAAQFRALTFTLTLLCVLPSFPQHNQANIRSTRTSLVRLCWTVTAECFLGDAVFEGAEMQAGG